MVNVWLYVAPDIMGVDAPESQPPPPDGAHEPERVVVWGFLPVFVQVTVSPTGMVSVLGWKKSSDIATAWLAAAAERVLTMPGSSDPIRTAIVNRRKPSQPGPWLEVVGRRT